ncbi:DEAD/DEAH box helicase [Flavimobilis sp. GY10621]|uniref:DEAD/DEAH box helicase n=1 Tax=Flavimobilis rhizosphaerae TaxID=2775421 RepID=A0ABR9DNV0_9MICO|nr:DEAD/DEAH box helicase [Flavimobilis rhizosphaerae]MBD9698007.1 DEAD/DEAH box helicase [Flavimobilis rhizosphaerae]
MPQTIRSFSDLPLPTPVLDALARDGKTAPFPIQTATLPDTLAGRDVLGRGRTGSGKTLAFSLPIVTRLDASRSGRTKPARPRALVLAPTRELASQIDATLAPLAKALGLTTTVIFGGVSQSRQVTALQKGVDVVVACPGRLEDLLGQRHLTLDDIEITVLDEADHMADLGFLPGVKRIMDRTPSQGQRMLFSATLDNGVDVLVKRYLHKPLHHSVDPETSPVTAMTHHVLEVADAAAKKDLVLALASGVDRRILFMRTKHQAKKMAKTLTAEGVPAVDLHGNLSQGARERNLEAFTSGAVKVLVATDIAARGIHVDHVGLVVHVDPPAEHKAYLHRSGRTARAGEGGVVVTVMTPEQRGDVKDLTRKAGITVTPVRVRATDKLVTDLVGEVAPRVKPSEAPAAAQPAPKQPRKKKAADGGRGRGTSTSDGSGRPARGSAGSRGSDVAVRGDQPRGGRPGTGRGGQQADPSRPGGARSDGRRGGSGRGASGQQQGRGGASRGGSQPVWSSTTGEPSGGSAGRSGGGSAGGAGGASGRVSRGGSSGAGRGLVEMSRGARSGRR